MLFGDCDPAGILYTPTIANYLVEACLAFLTERLGAPVERTMFNQGVSLPARAMNIEFLRSMTWDDIIHIEVAVESLRTRSLSLAIHGRNDAGETAFRGELAMVCISTVNRKAVTMPAALKRALESDD